MVKDICYVSRPKKDSYHREIGVYCNRKSIITDIRRGLERNAGKSTQFRLEISEVVKQPEGWAFHVKPFRSGEASERYTFDGVKSFVEERLGRQIEEI